MQQIEEYPNCGLCLGISEHQDGCPNAIKPEVKEIIIKCGYCGKEESNLVQLDEEEDFLLSKADGLCSKCEEDDALGRQR